METLEQQPQQPMSIGDWFVTMLLTAIPVVNIIMLIIWAFGANPNPNRANWAKATLIWMAISAVLSILFASTIIGLFGVAALL